MKIIQRLSELIEGEINDAGEYAKLAVMYKESDPKLGQMFFNLASAEMEHMKILHNAVADKITEYRNTHGDPPETMLAVYDYLHGKHIDNAGAVKATLSMFRE